MESVPRRCFLRVLAVDPLGTCGRRYIQAVRVSNGAQHQRKSEPLSFDSLSIISKARNRDFDLHQRKAYITGLSSFESGSLTIPDKNLCMRFEPVISANQSSPTSKPLISASNSNMATLLAEFPTQAWLSGCVVTFTACKVHGPRVGEVEKSVPPVVKRPACVSVCIPVQSSASGLSDAV